MDLYRNNSQKALNFGFCLSMVGVPKNLQFFSKLDIQHQSHVTCTPKKAKNIRTIQPKESHVCKGPLSLPKKVQLRKISGGSHVQVG